MGFWLTLFIFVALCAGLFGVIFLFSAKRRFRGDPKTLRIGVGETATLEFRLERKLAMSLLYKTPRADRAVNFLPTGETFIYRPLVTPEKTSSGVITVLVTGTEIGEGTLAAKAVSSRPGKTYGPNPVRIRVEAG